MAHEKYIPSGVWLTCDKGATPSQFSATPKGVKLYGQFYATEADLIPGLNIKPFGACAVTGSPCAPVPVQWLAVMDGGVKITGFKPLLDCSQCQCALGGLISIHFTEADANKHLTVQGIHQASNTAKEVSLWAFVGGLVLGVAGIACACTGVGAVAAPFLLAAAGNCLEVAAVTFEAAIVADTVAFAIEPTKENGWVLVGDALALATGKIIGKGLGILAEDLAETGAGKKVAEAIKPKDPVGTERTSAGRLRDAKTKKFVTDPNPQAKLKFRRSMAERKKALLRDADDPKSQLSPEARQYIKDTKGNKVPNGYEVHHNEPLATRQTIEGKKDLDVSENMSTISKGEHDNLHVRCGNAYHKISNAKKLK